MKYLDVPKSGSLASNVHSRNRYGQYVRNRSTPVNPNSAAQATVRARLGANAATWRTLDPEVRAGWASLGSLMTRTDSLGQTYSLTGHQAFNSVNNNLAAAGDALITEAPSMSTPESIATATITLTDSSFSVAYTPTPLATGERLFVFASPQRSAGRGFEGDYRLIQVGAAAGASPLSVFTSYEARFGTPVEGNRIFVALYRFFGGFLSAGLYKTQVVSS